VNAKIRRFEESEVLMLDLYCEQRWRENGMVLILVAVGEFDFAFVNAFRVTKLPVFRIVTHGAVRLKTAAERGIQCEEYHIVTVRT
jgi:hypothetical protein